MRMQYKTIGEINHYASENVNPARFPEQYFELYSVPHFSEGYPEIIKGKDVGATKQVVQEGDVLICKINPRINRVWKVTRHTDYPLIASSEWVIVRNADLNADYLTYYFSSPKFRVLINSELTGMGGSLTRAQPKQIRRYSVPVPDKEEQHFVVRNLALLDHLISLRQRQAEKLDELVKARFVEMFGDPVLNTRRLPSVSGTSLFKLSNGKAVPVEKRFDSGIPAYGGNGISWYTDEALINTDTLVVGRVGFQSGNVHFVYGPLWITDNAMYVTWYRKELICLRFLNQLMKRVDFSRYQDAGDLKKITQKPFMKFEYILPSMNLQMEFVNFMDSVNCEKERIQRSAALLETLKRSLMQQYFG